MRRHIQLDIIYVVTLIMRNIRPLRVSWCLKPLAMYVVVSP